MKDRCRSLSAQFGCLLCLAGLAGIGLFILLQVGGGALLSRYYENSDARQQYVEQQVADLQTYVEERGLSAQDAAGLTGWVKSNPLILVEIYRDGVLLYTSSAPEESSDGANDLEAPYYDWVSYYPIRFADGPADVVIYAVDTYRWLVYLTIAALLLSFLLFLAIFILGSRGLVRYIGQLSLQIQAMEGGDLDQPILIKGSHELSSLARGLDSMRRSFREQREREAQLFRANQVMITQMSHDLRTPLTALQIYTDILRYRRFQGGEQAEEYLNRIDAKVAQIKQLSENIFEYSLISGEQSVRLEPPRLARDVFLDPLSELVGYLEQQRFQFLLDLDWPAREIVVNAQYIKRLLDNIVSNLAKYADPAAPISISVEEQEDGVALSFSNTVRPNSHRSDSSRIGLSNMGAMMAKMGGSLSVNHNRSSFQVTLYFPVPSSVASQPCGLSVSGP